MVAVALSGRCRQSEAARAQHASIRATEETSVSGSATVQRVAFRQDVGRILHDAPSDLSAANAERVHAKIGADSALSQSEPLHHGAPPRPSRP